MSNPFFSVIVPMHNSEEYMRPGLDSIAAQSFRDYELIVVCDKCSDNTAEIAKSYDVKVPEITVDEVDFGKCGLTRNHGLDIARGEWILFMDDDDWFLHPYVFEMLHDQLIRVDCDIMACGFIWKRGDRNELTPWHMPQGTVWVAPWSKVWKRSFIGEHRFPAWKHSDDLGFAEEMYPLVDKFGYFPHAIYYYNWMREGSIQDKLAKGELSMDNVRE